MLEDPSMTHLQCSGWGKEVLVQDFMAYRPVHWPLNAVDAKELNFSLIWLQHFSEWIICSPAKLRWTCICSFLNIGTMRGVEVFSPLQCSVLPMVFMENMVPAVFISLTSSSLTPWDKALHGAPDRGCVMVILYFSDFHKISPTVRRCSDHAYCWWSCSAFQPCGGLELCPLHPSTTLWSCPWWWRGWNKRNRFCE